ncbi:MAG: hypothetical protein ACTTKH_05400 [Treponema sp.]
MATLVLLTGDSGTGKSASLRNFKSKEASVFNVAKKPLPFKNTGSNKLPLVDVNSYEELKLNLKRARNKTLIIDDAQYLMAFEFFGSIEEKGFDKFTRMGKNFYSLVKSASMLEKDKVIYFFMHKEIIEGGQEKAKTLGRLLDEKLTLEGLFTICLKTIVQETSQGNIGYYFSTRNSGYDRVKTPMGMFESPLIENDLKLVDDKIREFYELAPSIRDSL